MFWTLLFYLFLIIVFLIFLRLSTIKVNGRRVINFPMRVAIAFLFPIIFVLVALFSSIFLLFVMALLLIILLVFLLLFFLGKMEIWFLRPRKKASDNIIVVKSVRKKR